MHNPEPVVEVYLNNYRLFKQKFYQSDVLKTVLLWYGYVYKLVFIPQSRVSRQNKFVKLVRLVGFIIMQFVMMHGHMNVKSSHFVNIYGRFFLTSL